MQESLFTQAEDSLQEAPLAHRLRPKNRSEYIGIHALEAKYPFLKASKPKNMIIFGPPGSGKTTLATILCNDINIDLFTFSAVLSGVAELKKLFERAKESREIFQRFPVIFIDEIHRFNKAQQDALLPHVESGLFTLIGATTESPRSSIIKALQSRLQIIELQPIGFIEATEIVQSAAAKLQVDLDEEEISLMAEYSGGDARKAISNLEMAIHLKSSNDYSHSTLINIIKENSRAYDRNADRHYDVISAFIKSMRGSDPDAALLWLAVMLDGGEDPVFIARRLAIFASEDVGNADLNALTITNNTLNIVSNIGMPEARITLAQATTYLASTVKSNAAYLGINQALEYVKSRTTIEVPHHLKSLPDKDHSVKYQYPHSFEENWVDQAYAPLDTPLFYQPKDVGVEKNIKNRLSSLWGHKKSYN